MRDRVDNEPIVCVVTPFYNTCDFLAECIESVLRQTYDNWVYVLINNCSTDGSAEIAAEYASRFPEKIHLLHNDAFLSQVQNYNHALSCISPDSKYCKVVQADDWLFEDCIRSMVEVAETHPSVGIVSAYELEGDEVRLDGLPYPSTIVPGRQAARFYFLRGKYLFGTPTSLLLRSQLVRSRQPFYDERYAPFEDGHACFDLLREWDLGFVHQVLTFSRRDNASILASVRPFGIERFLRFSMLVVHGTDYLSPEEYTRCLSNTSREYLFFLAQIACARKRASREFWKFHRDGLASINYSLGWRLLWKWLPLALVQKIWDAFWAILNSGYHPILDDDLTLQ